MGQAAEMAKKNLGLKEPGKGEAGKPQKPDSMSELEAAIDLIDNVEAKELLSAKARQVKADLELRAREAEEKTARYKSGGGDGSNNDQAERTKLRLELTANAMQLLEKGVDPHVVAQYILGTSGPNISITPGGGGGVQGFTIADVITLVDKVRGNSGPSAEVLALQKTIDEMRAELKNLKPSAPTTPVDPVTAQANSLESLNKLVDNLVKAGFVVRPGTSGTNTGESIEMVKEKNRHDEKLAEIKEQEKYHGGLIETLQDTAERVGEGLAKNTERKAGDVEEDAAAPMNGPARETFTCPDCKTKIPIYPETGNQITCTKCGIVYTRKGTVEVKQ